MHSRTRWKRCTRAYSLGVSPTSSVNSRVKRRALSPTCSLSIAIV